MFQAFIYHSTVQISKLSDILVEVLSGQEGIKVENNFNKLTQTLLQECNSVP